MAARLPRALVVSQPTIGGVAITVRNLIREAASCGWQVVLACPADGKLSSWAAADGVPWEQLPMTRAPSAGDVAAIARVRRLARNVDVLHLHSSKAGAVGRLAALTLGTRRPAVVFTPHGWSWHVGGHVAWGYRVLERALGPLADAVVAVSPEEAQLGRATLGGRAQLRTITNGVDPDLFAPQGPRAERGDAPLIVCVGRFDRSKGQDVAIRALATLTHESAKLRLVGDGPERPELADLALALGIAERVEFAGEVDDPAPHYRTADVVVVPSRWDGMSLALLESMSCGAAVVGTNVPGTGILHEAGETVAVDDPVALGAAVDALLDDPERRARLGAAARQRVLTDHTLSQSTGQMLALWAELSRSAEQPR